MDWVGQLANLSQVWLILAGWALSCICGQLMASWSKRPCIRQFCSLPCISHSLLGGCVLMMVAGVQKKRKKCTGTSKAFTCTRVVNILLAKPSHMPKSGINVGGDQELQDRQPATGRPIWWPQMQLISHSAQLKTWKGAKRTFWKQSTVVPHYLKIPYMRICFLAKICL